jgi:hypothetical protein
MAFMRKAPTSTSCFFRTTFSTNRAPEVTRRCPARLCPPHLLKNQRKHPKSSGLPAEQMAVPSLTTAALLLSSAALVSSANNGRAVTPPGAWRSWNQYQGDVSQSMMMGIFDALASRNRPAIWNGSVLSLVDLGYTDAGLDDNWQACGAYGPNNYTYHNASGYPQIDLTRFPDMRAMNDYAHSLGLTTGWCEWTREGDRDKRERRSFRRMLLPVSD